MTVHRVLFHEGYRMDVMCSSFKIKKYMLEMIEKVFKKKEVQSSYIEERAFFKMNFWRFYMKRRKGNSSLEFWAHLTIPYGSRAGEHILHEEGDFYIGKVKDEDWIKPKNFYTLPWNVQQGGDKLYHVYLKERKNLNL